MNTCDVENCYHKDNAVIDTDSDIPEGWGTITLPDSQGEHQTYNICPNHINDLWRYVENQSPKP